MKKTNVLKVKPKKLSVAVPCPKDADLYDSDFYRWTRTQANLLKKNQLSDLDIEHLREEIESLGKSDRRSLRSHLINLLKHMLKMEFQPQKKTNSWEMSVRNATQEIELILLDSPSLIRQMPKLIDEAYEFARNGAAEETGLKAYSFPKSCPETYKQRLDFRKK